MKHMQLTNYGHFGIVFSIHLSLLMVNLKIRYMRLLKQLTFLVGI